MNFQKDVDLLSSVLRLDRFEKKGRLEPISSSVIFSLNYSESD